MNSELEIRPVTTVAEMEAVYRLTHQCYVTKGYAGAQQNGLLLHYPEYDVLPETTVLGAYQEGQLLGSISYTRPGPFGCPCDKEFRDERQGAESEGRIVVDLWRLVVKESCRSSRKIVFALFAESIRRTVQQKVTSALLVVNPLHQGLYQRLFNAQIIGQREATDGLSNAPAVLLRFDKETLPPEWNVADCAIQSTGPLGLAALESMMDAFLDVPVDQFYQELETHPSGDTPIWVLDPVNVQRSKTIHLGDTVLQVPKEAIAPQVLQPIIAVQDVRKYYPLGKTHVAALQDISLAIHRGEFLAISGPSGSGKTTLLNLLGCIEKPSSGKIVVDSRDVTTLDPDQLADLRATSIGFIFQNFNLLPVLSAAENIEYPLLDLPLSKAQRREKVAACLKAVGLEEFAAHKPRELSGGQRQRVAIARALVKEPRFILADEPTANLDHQTGHEIIQLMKNFNLKHGTTFIFSTHDPKVMTAASRVISLTDGRLERDAQHVLDDRLPQHI